MRRVAAAARASSLALLGALGAGRALGPARRRARRSSRSWSRRPSDVAESLWDDRELLAENAWVTAPGGRCSGFALALVARRRRSRSPCTSPTPLRRAFYPLLVASQTVPVIAIAPILVVWLGFGIGPKLAIIALVCFFPITVNTLDGLRSVDPELPRMMRTLDAGRCADPAPGRGPVGAAVPLQRRQDRRGDLGDRRRLRRVVGRRRRASAT